MARQKLTVPPREDDISAARALLHKSHLSPSKAQANFTEFEFALHHITEAFARFSATLHEYVSGESLPVQDVSVLQLIRMNERAKSAAEIGRFLNREDASNILYALRKLDKTGLIKKSGGASRQTTYQVTPKGRALTDGYAQMRNEILLEAVNRIPGLTGQLAAVTQAMWHISGLYEQAARTTSMMQMLQAEAQPAPAKAVAKPVPLKASRRPRRAGKEVVAA